MQRLKELYHRTKRLIRPPLISWSTDGEAWDYPPGWKINPLERQLALMRQAIPGLPSLHPARINLQVAQTMSKGTTRSGRLIDGISHLPSIPLLGELLEVNDPYDNYHLLLSQLLFIMKSKVGLTTPYVSDNDRLPLSANMVRINPGVREQYQSLDERLGTHHYHLWPVSLGRSHAHMLPSEARQRALRRHELPLCSVHIGLLILANPSRFSILKSMWMDCAGDDGWWEPDGWIISPFFRFTPGLEWEDGIRFNIDGSVPEFSGSPVAFPEG